MRIAYPLVAAFLAVAVTGVALRRPRDVVSDPATGLVYVLNLNAPVVTRFSPFGA